VTIHDLTRRIGEFGEITFTLTLRFGE
jgi:hypothetical protein